MRLSEVRIRCPQCGTIIDIHEWVKSLESKEWMGDGNMWDCEVCKKWTHYSNLEVVTE